MKRVTITDVANSAGVSKSTVSHVINKTRFVEEATRQKVLAAIDSLGYRPSNIARSLVSKRTKTAGLLISDVGNPFYSEVILGAEEVAMQNDYSIFLCNTSYDLERGMRYIHSLIDRSVDGLLFMSSRMSLEMVEEVIKNQIQAVIFDWEDAHLDDQAATITIDFREGIREAVRHLVELGHREISHVSGPLNLWTAQVRRDAFLDSLRECGLDPKRSVIVEGDLRIEGGRNAFEQLIHRTPRPTAVFAANDLMALGVLWAARNYGLELPAQLSVVGLDDIDLASKVTPTLTTVALPRYEMGKQAMKTLLTMIEKPSEFSGGKLEIATRLIIRQSTAPPTGAWVH